MQTFEMIKSGGRCYCADCVGRSSRGTAPKIWTLNDKKLSNPDGCMCIYCYIRRDLLNYDIDFDKISGNFQNAFLKMYPLELAEKKYKTYKFQKENIFADPAVHEELVEKNKVKYEPIIEIVEDKCDKIICESCNAEFFQNLVEFAFQNPKVRHLYSKNELARRTAMVIYSQYAPHIFNMNYGNISPIENAIREKETEEVLFMLEKGNFPPCLKKYYKSRILI